MSPDCEQFATTSSDREIRIFKFRTGKISRKYDESVATISRMHEEGTSMVKLDDIEFGKRLAIERDLDKSNDIGNVVYDESGLFIMYATMLGIKLINTSSNTCVKIFAKDERIRPLHLALYQGTVETKIRTIEMAASDNPLLAQAGVIDPILFASAHQSHRFYLFGNTASDDRDAYNEKPTAQVTQTEITSTDRATSATLHTSAGDITLTLFPDHAPKAVENFITHARQGYYDRTIFHRIIKQFMIQGGDPEGTGTGGTSIWGKEFDDEISDLKHEAYTLSMANAGPNSNGSQFFITTVPTPHLDGKHTVFGRVSKGIDVVHEIERAKVGRLDRPVSPVEIHSIDVAI